MTGIGRLGRHWKSIALGAYPAEYENSGVLTFIVNHDGKVFEKNLGKDKAKLAQSMKGYNPDSTWSAVKQ